MAEIVAFSDAAKDKTDKAIGSRLNPKGVFTGYIADILSKWLLTVSELTEDAASHLDTIGDIIEIIAQRHNIQYLRSRKNNSNGKGVTIPDQSVHWTVGVAKLNDTTIDINEILRIALADSDITKAIKELESLSLNLTQIVIPENGSIYITPYTFDERTAQLKATIEKKLASYGVPISSFLDIVHITLGRVQPPDTESSHNRNYLQRLQNFKEDVYYAINDYLYSLGGGISAQPVYPQMTTAEAFVASRAPDLLH